mmetsp:Transcript_16048/g.50305  ORF Transcript_16048/g.50305 Transcript_16048/m.50305 type:complete len:338 (+) Transcript_16048:118-1131(+)
MARRVGGGGGDGDARPGRGAVRAARGAVGRGADRELARGDDGFAAGESGAEGERRDEMGGVRQGERHQEAEDGANGVGRRCRAVGAEVGVQAARSRGARRTDHRGHGRRRHGGPEGGEGAGQEGAGRQERAATGCEREARATRARRGSRAGRRRHDEEGQGWRRPRALSRPALHGESREIRREARRRETPQGTAREEAQVPAEHRRPDRRRPRPLPRHDPRHLAASRQGSQQGPGRGHGHSRRRAPERRRDTTQKRPRRPRQGQKSDQEARQVSSPGTSDSLALPSSRISHIQQRNAWLPKWRAHSLRCRRFLLVHLSWVWPCRARFVESARGEVSH